MLDFSIPTILFTVINILVLFLFLKKFLFGRVNAIMEKRAQMVQADLDHAKETVAEQNNSKPIIWKPCPVRRVRQRN